MNTNSSNPVAAGSLTDRLMAISLATLSMFVVGYSATRVVLNALSTDTSATAESITPHQAEMWKVFGQRF
ncbi:hypothetical protein [Lyngbya confervoides]|uniref:MFS transporter n=1 Tax=Lyngbya confervoides BDU141951 TaxID=1574623 RepID=A0ABD4T415_9CYAN|nr:hypothetical protein [Lyngbya confervoides]MCM1983324.1 hypothetical protein [Lyngbya confervoides BDU141951]